MQASVIMALVGVDGQGSFFSKSCVLHNTAPSPGAHTPECLESYSLHWKTLVAIGGRRADAPHGSLVDVVSLPEVENI